MFFDPDRSLPAATIASLAAVLFGCASSLAQTCTPGWLPVPSIATLGGPPGNPASLLASPISWVRSWDFDGPTGPLAPRLVCNGALTVFPSIPGCTVTDVICYDPATDRWSRLDSVGRLVRSMVAPAPDGSLYVLIDPISGCVSGTPGLARFDSATSRFVRVGPATPPPFLALTVLANSQPVYASDTRIRRFDGTAWIDIGTVVGTVRTLAADALGGLYAGGSFSSINGVSVNGIAHFDGTQWRALGSGVQPLNASSGVSAIVVAPDGAVIVGGNFTTAGGLSASRVARWDGSQWSALGPGFDDEVLSLQPLPNGHIIAGGRFITSGTNSMNGVARWNGSAWQPLGAGFGGFIATSGFFLFPDNTLAAAGSHSTAGGLNYPYLARYALGALCRADFNCSGLVSIQDVFDFTAEWFAGNPRADFNAAGGITIQDVFDFLAAWFAAC